MGQMFRINEEKKGSGKPLSRERGLELEKILKNLTSIENRLKACKDCEEWICWTCDNEGCPNNEMEPGCYTGECTKHGDLQPHCKDCDEWQCVSCDNEK